MVLLKEIKAGPIRIPGGFCQPQTTAEDIAPKSMRVADGQSEALFTLTF
jgi:hypothetical protein